MVSSKPLFITVPVCQLECSFLALLEMSIVGHRRLAESAKVYSQRSRMELESPPEVRENPRTNNLKKMKENGDEAIPPHKQQNLP